MMGTKSISKAKRDQPRTDGGSNKRKLTKGAQSRISIATRNRIVDGKASKADSDQQSSGLAKLGHQKLVPEGVDPRTIVPLPFDVLLAICKLLDVRDTVSFSEASKFFRDVAAEYSVWFRLAYRYQCDSRILVLDDLIHPNDLSTEDLRLTVLRTNKLESSWNSQVIKPINSRIVKKLWRQISTTLKIDDIETSNSFYLSNEFFVQQTQSKRLLVYDMLRNKFAASFNLTAYEGFVVLRVNHRNRTLYGVIDGTVNDSLGDEFAANIALLRIVLPENEGFLSCERLTECHFPLSWRIIRHVPDALHERFALLFRIPGDSRIKIFIVLGFGGGTASIAFCDTDLDYHYKRMTTSLWFSPDGNSIHLSTIIRGVWHSLRFSIEQLKKTASDWITSIPLSHRDGMKATESFTVDLGLSSIIDFQRDRLIQSCNLSQWWQKYDGVPKCASRLLMCGQNFPGSLLTAVQMYTSDEGALVSRPFVFEIIRAVMINDGSEKVPLMGASFNHLAWIEELSQDDKALWNRKRTLRLVSYPNLDLLETRDGPPPLDDHRGDSDVHKFVSVPDEVLCRAFQIFPEPALGGIIITTTEQEFYRFPFV